MDIIPVLDVKGGAVVRAVRGERAAYQPIRTRLSPSSDPVEVARGLVDLCRSKALYIADLDAIENRGNAGEAIHRVTSALPTVRLWIDNGCAEESHGRAVLADYPNAHLVLGSESQQDTETIRALGREQRVLLSLDFRGGVFQGPPELLARPRLWPRRVIVMSLTRIGSKEGPDFGKLSEVLLRAGDRRIYAAGGVRDRRDLASLRAAGAAGALVASALHDGQLGPADLQPEMR